jgi:hypothetical protein
MQPSPVPSRAELEWRLLDEANEDWCGLWEPCWSLRTDFSLDLSDADLGAILEPLMRDPVHRGLLALYWNQWVRAEYVAVPPEQVDSLLANPQNWSAPPTAEHSAVWFGATEAGEQAWRALQGQRANDRG